MPVFGGLGRSPLPETPPRSERPPHPVWGRPGVLLAVAAGGLIGAPARYELGLAVHSTPGAFPLSTFVINVSGSFVLGLLLTFVVGHWPPREYLRAFAATGVLGAYTTWSTFVVGSDDLLRGGHPWTALFYVLATLAGGLVAVSLGILLGRRAAGSRSEESW